MAASNRVKIEARVSEEGTRILGTNWVAIDLEKDFSPRFSKDVNTLSDVNLLITDGMLNFAVPRSKTNDIVFMASSSPVITDNKDTGVECRVSVDGRQYPFDRIWVKNKLANRWEIEVRRSPNHWLELASKKKLNTVDIGTELLDNTVRDNLYDQSFVPGGPIARWLPCDYGNFVDLAEPANFTDPPVKGIYYEDLRPWICVPEFLRIGFCELGWTLQGLILETRWSRAIFAYLLSREYYTQSKGGNHIVIGLNTTGFGPNSIIFSPILFNSLQYDPGANSVPFGPVYAGAIWNSLPYKAKYRFYFIGFLTNTTGADASIGVSIADFDLTTGAPTGVLYWVDEFFFEPNETRLITIEQFVDVEPDTRASFVAGPSTAIDFDPGFRIIIEPGQKSLVRGDVVELGRLINAEYFLLDLFKGYIHMIGGRIETDIENKIVSVYSYKYTDAYGDPAEGFIKDDEVPIDLDGMVICDSEQLGRIRNKLPRYTRLAFADSTDTYVSEFVKPQEPLFSRKILNGEDLQDTVNELKNPFFEPTWEAQPQILKQEKNTAGRYHPTPYMPVLHDNTEGNRSFAIGPRVLFFYGGVQQLDPSSGLACKVYLEDAAIPGLPTGNFGYGAHLPTLGWLPGTEPDVDAKLVYGSHQDDLYVKFYLDTLSIQKAGFDLNMLVLLSGTNFSAWDFRTKFRYTMAGKPVVMFGQRIRDFAAALDIATPMDFVIEAPNTTCCDLPCGCRFQECDYYQDFGQYMTQETLDSLSITSFKVNQIEQLVGPVDFGILRIVEFNGLQFCMNMVDGLNSAGVDYFTFRPSSQVYAPKSDARFFKIKRPACWTFEIIISDADGEVYKYTEATQQQKWFDADWAPFGYSETPVGDPNNCAFSNEY